ncbi:MAG: MoxR family ATPase [Deltaproteobacteria bacterium]|nr:MoxR family ATPase [Deltaproteobacteria bacterium]MBN2845988.1 MoxR family ATPase [Deltaproteobacteria bacterium]
MNFRSVEDAQRKLENAKYIASKEIATVVFLGDATNKPILVEGPAGVGKTELAKAVAQALTRDLIRLQCYEGLDESKALYEWEYAKQLLYTQMLKEKIHDIIDDAQTLNAAVDKIAVQENAFFSEHFIQPRPLLQAISSEEPVVLLIDEVDKSDPEFEAFLLELLSDFQVSIPELGTIRARNIPFVVLTSNNYRDMSDTLQRRCLHLYIDYPDQEREIKIINIKFPGINERLARKIVNTIRDIRDLDLKKKPCVSETLDWTRSLMALQVNDISHAVIADTLNVICKNRPDTEKVKTYLNQMNVTDNDIPQ